MGKVFSTAGSTLSIGGVMAFEGTDLTEADFSTETWQKVTGITDLGSAGDQSELITTNQVSAERQRKLKGTRDAGSMEVVMDLDYSDAGQIALIAAEKDSKSYAFKLTFNDAPEGGTPSERYFVALVMSAREAYSNANSVQQLNVTLAIDSNVARVAAAGAP